MPTFVVKRIVKTDVDEGENKKSEKWTVNCETSASDDKVTISTDTLPNYKVGDELELTLKSRQKKLV